jgi:hypothetical protein
MDTTSFNTEWVDLNLLVQGGQLYWFNHFGKNSLVPLFEIEQKLTQGDQQYKSVPFRKDSLVPNC